MLLAAQSMMLPFMAAISPKSRLCPVRSTVAAPVESVCGNVVYWETLKPSLSVFW